MKINNQIEEDGQIIYCGIRNCPHYMCLRHNVNTPFNKLILREDFKPNKNWECKDIIIKGIEV